MAARRKTSVTGMRTFSPILTKGYSASMSTTIGDSRDPARVKVVIFSLRDLFPTDTFTKSDLDLVRRGALGEYHDIR